MRTHAPVNFLPPNPAGLCGQAWALFAKGAVANAPVVSAQLPAIAAATGFNLGNLKIELSRYNRYTAAAAAGTLVAPPAKAAKTVQPANPASALAANAFVEAEAIALRELAASKAPMLQLPAPTPAPAKHGKHGKK